MPWIANHSFSDINKGLHPLAPGRTVLIRIADMGHIFSDNDVFHFEDFVDVHRFRFQDIEPTEVHDITQYGEMVPAQAAIMHDILRRALNEGNNVLVHCAAGLCRSGAVTEVGVLMGFQDVETFRIPNLHVKKLLLKQAGLFNSWDDAAEEARVKELTAKHFLVTTGGILIPREGDV